MLLKIYFSKLNKKVTNTATFSIGYVRFQWTPPSFLTFAVNS
ncbi:MAG: hypothetical protein VW397_03890 [Candidatus Margulisiibacteriota bacterium]